VRWRRVAFYALAVLFAAWTLMPIVLIALAALTPRQELYSWPRPFIPTAISLDSYQFFVNSYGVLAATFRSIVVALVTVFVALLVGAPAGYALARFKFRGKEAFRIGILTTRMFPTSLLAIPLAVLYLKANIYDTILGLAFMHTALAMPFVVLITSSLFLKVPYDLEEAAMTLGCSRMGAFVRISLPIALPSLVAAGIYTFVLSWNEVFASAVLTVNNRTLPAHIVATLNTSPLHFKFAGGFFMIIPALIFIFIVRRYLLSMWGVAINK
jgi:multiple sugar transport system permease protein